MRPFLIYIFLLVAGAHSICAGQPTARWPKYFGYNININSGLPSNHIYHIMTDRLGYLWMATTNGVVRYNGYECKVFNISNGLPTNDVWSLTEDKQGRIWLGTISREIGYIANGTYHKAAGIKGLESYYPYLIRALDNGIIFENKTAREFADEYFLFNDGGMKRLYPPVSFVTDTIALLSMDGKPFCIVRDSLYAGELRGDTIKFRSLFKLDTALHKAMTYSEGGLLLAKNYLFECIPNVDYFWRLNIHTGDLHIIHTSDYLPFHDTISLLAIRNVSNDERYISIIAQRNILQFKDDDTLKFAGSRAIKDLSGDTSITGGQVTSFIEGALWNSCLSTGVNGLYINIGSESPPLRKSDIDLRHFIFVGKTSEATSYWWNKSDRILARVDDNRKLTPIKLNGINDVNRVIPYNKDTSILLSSKHNSWLSNSNGALSNADARFGNEVFTVEKFKEALSAIEVDDKTIYVASKKWFYCVSSIGQQLKRRVFDMDRYNDLVYDPIKKMILAYNHDKIYVHPELKKDFIITTAMLEKCGVRQLDHIIVDSKYGNVLLKSDDKLLLYDIDKQQAEQILTNFNFTGATVAVYKGTLVAAGKFGIIFSKINGLRQIAPPVLYTNLKNGFYNYVADIEIANQEVLLNTDKATYTIPLPADSIMASTQKASGSFKYKFVINYRDSSFSIKNGDTIFIDHDDHLLNFDLINPVSNGKVRYKYCLYALDSSWHELKGDLLNVSGLSAGDIATLGVIAYDDAFKSNVITVHLYLIPYWWQTMWGRAVIVFSLMLLLAAFAWVIRRGVLKNQQKRHLRMEMELKSIHAQLNPHFIFNSLTSALYLVRKNRMNEAAEHISKFSSLLRAYLKSSRDKFITIHDEINNLRNYIELQQERFDNSFAYELQVDESINTREEYIPSLLVQPFVENAIDHGLFHSKKDGRLTVAFFKREEEHVLFCTVTDNGVGRKRSKEMATNKKGPSYGNDLIRDLVRIFSTYEKMKIDVKYVDIEGEETGTRVEISIKKQ